MIRTTPSHKKLTASRLLLAAAALALPSLAFAQGQIDTGRSNDASNRVGGNGRNDNYTNINRYSNSIINNGNQVVTGNVTMGREFRGPVQYTNPYALRAPTAGFTSDNFIKNSAGVPQPHSREVPPNQSTTFFGAAQTATPPPGFTMAPNKAGYVPPPAVGAPRDLADQRLGVVDFNQPITPTIGSNTLITRGSLTPGGENPPGIITGSSLYGVREWNPQNAADRLFLETMLQNQGNVLDRLRIAPKELQRMRDELQKTVEGDPNRIGENQPPASARRPADALSLNPLGGGFDTPANPALSNKPLNDRLENNQLQGGLQTEQTMRQKLLGQAQRTSEKYSELNKRLDEYYGERKKTDADFAREFNAAVKAREAAKAKGDPDKKNPAGGINDVNPLPTPPGDAPKPGDPVNPLKVKKPAPLKIANLHEGIRAQGLANLMKKAEELMKEGRFVSALDQYEAAEAVSPNNPLIWLGKGNAELGAGLFARADAHLRQAFSTDKALLMGQYDLRNMLGEQRLEKLVADLKDIANKDQKPTSVWLLAYISYNSGNEPMALGFLELAEKRAGGQDPFFKLVKEHWSLSDTKPEAPKPEAEKPAPGPATENK